VKCTTTNIAFGRHGCAGIQKQNTLNFALHALAALLLRKVLTG